MIRIEGRFFSHQTAIIQKMAVCIFLQNVSIMSLYETTRYLHANDLFVSPRIDRLLHR